jgi:3-oxoacyl-[acyl-carrier protein] reductase
MLADKRVLVTGGSRGIGAEVVRAALGYGADVAFTYRTNAEAADAHVAGMRATFPERRCTAFRADVADAQDMRRVLSEVMEVLGRIDVLVNNAGVARDAAFARLRQEDWNEVINTNLGSMYNVTQPLIMAFVRQRSGSVVNMTSIVGLYGAGGQASYAASKAGIVGITKALAKEVGAFGVRVNAVAPGLIDTDMLAAMPPERLAQLTARIPAGRLGTAGDVAEVVSFLASDRSRYVTGQVIEVSGGLVL